MSKTREIQRTHFGHDARKRIKKGVDTIANAVRTTMGGKGLPVMFHRGVPVFTRDGVTVAKRIDILEDNLEHYGGQLVKNVAGKTNDEAGDGTTTATVIFQKMVEGGVRGVESGFDALKIKEGMEIAKDVALTAINKNSHLIETLRDKESIATISSRDPKLGKIIAETYDKIGNDGVITTEETKLVGIFPEVVEGIQIDGGMLNPHFATVVEGGKQKCILENPSILVTSQVLKNPDDLVHILNEVVARNEKKSLFIIADTVEGFALNTLILNKLNGIINVVAVKAPSYGDNKKNVLQDIAVATGTIVVSEEVGLRVDTVDYDDLGKADKIIVDDRNTIIIGAGGNQEELDKRREAIKVEIEQEVDNKFQKEYLERRYAKLAGGIARIRIGAETPEATKELMYRVEDAVNSTKSALEEGVVSGAGMLYYNIALELAQLENETIDTSVRYGIQVVREALQEPATQILKNAGVKVDVVLEEAVRTGKVYDVISEKFVDPFEGGIIDPKKVERVALINAVSTAELVIEMDTVIETVTVPEV